MVDIQFVTGKLKGGSDLYLWLGLVYQRSSLGRIMFYHPYRMSDYVTYIQLIYFTRISTMNDITDDAGPWHLFLRQDSSQPILGRFFVDTSMNGGGSCVGPSMH
jgi:hypothetical protein